MGRFNKQDVTIWDVLIEFCKLIGNLILAGIGLWVAVLIIRWWL